MGHVKDAYGVKINGADFMVDQASGDANISALVKPGENQIEVTVANSLLNAVLKNNRESSTTMDVCWTTLIWVMQNTRESNAAAGRAAVFMRSPADSQKSVQPTEPTTCSRHGESANGLRDL